MPPAVATLSLISLVALSLARAPTPRTTKTTPAPYTRQFSDLPDYDTYRFVERLRSEQARQQRERDGSTSATSRARFLPRIRVSKPIILYIACSCVLTGVVLLVTLMAFHTIRGGSGARSSMHGVSYALLDRRPLLGKRRDEDSDDEEETAIDAKNARQQHERRKGSVDNESFEISTLSEIGVGDGATSWSEPDAPSESIWNDQDTVNRPADVFPSRLLDLCNQDTPLTFLTFLPKGCQHRSKWLAHGHHSEVFQVASPLKRTVLKVIPVTGVFTDQRVDAIAAAIECSVKLSLLRHGVRYRTPSFVETQRIACVFDLFPKWLLSGDRGLGSRDVQAGTNQCFLTRHFIVLELGYAGKPLSRITLRSAVQGRSVVLQASCCMAVAERALGFRHLSANPDKLLGDGDRRGEPRVPPSRQVSADHRQRGPQGARRRLLVLRARTGLDLDSSLANALAAAPHTAPREKLRMAVLLSLSIVRTPGERAAKAIAISSAWLALRVRTLHDVTILPVVAATAAATRSSEALRFKGNVTWLGAVVGSVMRKLRSELPESRARAERGLVEELSMLQRRLQQCDSVGEFFDTLSI
ncbi:hypothetical protein MRX96_037750 [Rhipicephalus microplus]